MDISYFDDLIDVGFKKVKILDRDFYLRRLSVIDGSLYDIMSDKELADYQKANRCLLLSLCNEKGNAIFQIDNEEHIQKVSNIKEPYKTLLIEEMSEYLFPSKKKSKELKKRSFLSWLWPWEKQ